MLQAFPEREPLFVALEQGAVLLTSSQRLARQVHWEYAGWKQRTGLRAWPTPAILSWQAWLNDLARAATDEWVLLNARQEELLWERVIRESEGENLLLDLRAAASGAATAWKLVQDWRTPLDDPSWEQQQDPQAFRRWAIQFREECRERDWMAPASLPAVLGKRLASGAIPLPAAILLAGFDELTPRQEELISIIRDHGTRVSELSLARERAEQALCLPCKDTEEEIRAAATWAWRVLEGNPEVRIGVVALDLAPLRSQLERAFLELMHPDFRTSSGLPARCAFSLSLGIALDSEPMIHTALVILGFARGRCGIEETGHVLRSPFVSGSSRETGGRAALDAEIRSYGRLDIPLEGWLAAAQASHCPELAALLREYFEGAAGLPAQQPPSGWARSFSALVRAMGWPGDRPLNSREYQALGAWHDLFSEFAALDQVLGRLAFPSALSLLRQMAAEAIFQPESEQAPVEIMGSPEAAGARFDSLWILGMHDQDWPTPAKPNPFLPIVLQRQLGLPHSSPEREYEFARRSFERLLSSAKEVIASYPQREEDSDLRPSPFLKGMPTLGMPPAPLQDFRALLRAAAAEERFIDERGPGLEVGTGQRGGSNLFRLQALCPFRAFATLRLNARELDTPGPGLDPRSRGVLLHDALNGYWNRTLSQQGMRSAGDEGIVAAVREAIERFCEENPLPPRFREVEEARLEVLLREWLAVEDERAGFTVVMGEKEAKTELGGVSATVRIDRVDRLESGELVLIDYKSRAPSPKDWQTERPAEPQIPLYACAFGGELAAVAFAQVRPGRHRFLGIADRADILPNVKAGAKDLETQRREWRGVLTRLAEQFRNGAAAVDPKQPFQTCRDCALSPLCRVNEMEALRLRQEEAEEEADA